MTQMKVQSVRFGGYQWNAINRAAGHEGVTTAQFVRETVFARAVLVLYLAGDDRVMFGNLLARAFKDHPELEQALREVLASDDSSAVSASVQKAPETALSE
jgi:uncharacterized protein (DUF1778 family)